VSILFGHPTGNPNSHHAALAHFERGRLEAFVVPWMPTPSEQTLLNQLPGTQKLVSRLHRRYFEPLMVAPRIEGRMLEVLRLLRRALSRGADDERLAYEANDWLMRTMARECRRAKVSAVHSYEDCSLWQFEEAERLGKARIYDMPIGYYPAWQDLEKELASSCRDWLPSTGISSRRFVRPEQKKREMELANLVLAPSRFVEKTIQRYVDKPCAIASYGVNSDFWTPASSRLPGNQLRFLFAGQVSLRKGVHILLEAWRKANLPEAELKMVGRWDLADSVRRLISGNITYVPPCSHLELREHYRSADVFVFPSFFEGFGLVLLEAMACGLPFIASDSSGAGPDLAHTGAGYIVPTGDCEALLATLQKISNRRDSLPQMRIAARAKACKCSWKRYREAVSNAVAPFC
jgi:glycosyltransferase involved in cell wall biosynthesis